MARVIYAVLPWNTEAHRVRNVKAGEIPGGGSTFVKSSSSPCLVCLSSIIGVMITSRCSQISGLSSSRYLRDFLKILRCYKVECGKTESHEDGKQRCTVQFRHTTRILQWLQSCVCLDSAQVIESTDEKTIIMCFFTLRETRVTCIYERQANNLLRLIEKPDCSVSKLHPCSACKTHF